jgi:transcriptional regulator with XRE-family HTH domain
MTIQPDRARFAERLRALRLEKLLTQVELAERIESTPTEVSRWEQGHRQPQLRMMRRLCDALGVEPSALLGTTEETV